MCKKLQKSAQEIYVFFLSLCRYTHTCFPDAYCFPKSGRESFIIQRTSLVLLLGSAVKCVWKVWFVQCNI